MKTGELGLPKRRSQRVHNRSCVKRCCASSLIAFACLCCCLVAFGFASGRCSSAVISITLFFWFFLSLAIIGSSSLLNCSTPELGRTGCTMLLQTDGPTSGCSLCAVVSRTRFLGLLLTRALAVVGSPGRRKVSCSRFRFALLAGIADDDELATEGCC